MTGPDSSVKALLKVSNLATNRQPTEEELEELRACIGFGATDVATERCVVREQLDFREPHDELQDAVKDLSEVLGNFGQIASPATPVLLIGWSMGGGRVESMYRPSILRVTYTHVSSIA